MADLIFRPLRPSFEPPDPREAARQARRFANDAFETEVFDELIANLRPPVIDPEFPVPDAASPPERIDPPSLEPIIWKVPPPPEDFVKKLQIDDFLPDPFDESPPTLNFPEPPARPDGDVPDAPEIRTDFDTPELDLTLPEAPELMQLNISEFDGINMPTIDERVPELNIAAPVAKPHKMPAKYNSQLLEKVRSHVYRQIDEGGTGLNPTAEQALWDRGREREAINRRDAVRQLERMETMGYMMPPGAYLDARTRIIEESQRTEVGLSREIMIKQAELELENTLKAVDQGIQFENMLIDYTNQVEQRVFDASRHLLDSQIAIYNAEVQAYSAYLDAYRTKVQIYESKIQGERAKVDAYRAQIDAEQAKASINRALVEQYQIEANISLSAIEVYKAEIDAIRTKAEIERTKVEIFGEEVRAYSAGINAYTADVEAFRSRVGAETARQDAFTSQVRAYSATVDAGAKQIDARIAEHNARLESKRLEWDGYRAIAQTEGERMSALAAKNSSAADVFRSKVQEAASVNELLTAQWQAATEQAQRVAEIGVAAAEANAELYMTTRSLAFEAAKVSAQTSAQVAASALSQFNHSTSYSYSGSESVSNSRSFSRSVSDSDVTSRVMTVSA